MDELKLYQIKQLIKHYGSNTTLQEIFNKCIQNTPYQCPQCEGEGGKYIKRQDFDNPHDVISYISEFIECDVCKGHGYTAKRLKPVYKTEVVGYE